MSLLLALLGGGTIETITVDKGDLTLTGKTVSVVDTQLVAKADLLFTGRTVSVVDTTLVNAASLTLTGKLVEANDFQVISPAALLFSGKPVSETETVLIAKADLTFSGQSVNTLDANVIPVDAGSLTLTGQSITVTDNEIIDAATLVFAGGDVASVETTPEAIVGSGPGVRPRNQVDDYYSAIPLLKQKIRKEQEEEEAREIAAAAQKVSTDIAEQQAQEPKPAELDFSLVATPTADLAEFAKARMEAQARKDELQRIDDEDALIAILMAA